MLRKALSSAISRLFSPEAVVWTIRTPLQAAIATEHSQGPVVIICQVSSVEGFHQPRENIRNGVCQYPQLLEG